MRLNGIAGQRQPLRLLNELTFAGATAEPLVNPVPPGPLPRPAMKFAHHSELAHAKRVIAR